MVFIYIFSTYFILFISLFNFSLYSKEIISFQGAIKKERAQYKEDLHNQIQNTFSKEFSNENEIEWLKALKAMEILNYKNVDGIESIRRLLNNYKKLSKNLKKQVLQTTYTLFSEDFIDEVENISKITKSPINFVICIQYLRQLDSSEDGEFLKLLETHFNNSNDSPILWMLKQELNISIEELFKIRPPLIDLLQHSFEKDKPIIYVLLRHDRSFPGILVVKNGKNKFIRNSESSIFHIPILGKSITNLPSYIQYGNTPQGILYFKSIEITKNPNIGPNPAIITGLPFELNKSNFLNRKFKSPDWAKEDYLNLFPKTWRDYFPILQSYIAGESGRGGIYIHGTTIDPNFNIGENFYPNAPTLGCISLKEIWSEKDGKLLYSDLVSLLSILKKNKIHSGYLVVVELNDEQMPVTLEEVIMDIIDVENN